MQEKKRRFTLSQKSQNKTLQPIRKNTKNITFSNKREYFCHHRCYNTRRIFISLDLVVSTRARSGVVVFGLVVIVVASLGGGRARRTGLVDQRGSNEAVKQENE